MRKLIKSMTIEEKAAQMHQLSDNDEKSALASAPENLGTIGSYLFAKEENKEEYFRRASMSDKKIPPIYGIDAIHGHSCLRGATIFPSQLALASTFDEELIEEVGVVTAREVAADGHHWVFSPVLCMARDLRWGRVGETFGEDTELVSRLGAAIVRGYQRDGSVAACAKHYIAYGEATGGRDSYDTQITERRAREVLLPPFKAAVDAGCMTVMTAYGSIDAAPITSSHRWLTEILKEELGFDGFVVTDWTNVRFLLEDQRVAEDLPEAVAMSINAGNDMSMNVPEFYEAMIYAQKEGLISAERVDDALERILRVKEKIGLLNNSAKRPDRSVIGQDEHRRVNLRAAIESCILLENDGTLPLKSVKKIAVVGPNADDVRAQYGDWTYFTHPATDELVTPSDGSVTVLDGLKKEPGIEVVYAKGATVTEAEGSDELMAEALAISKDADIVIAVIGDDVSYNGEWKDRAHLNVTGRQIELLKKIKENGKKVVTVMISGRPLIMTEVKKYSNAIIECFNGGDLCGEAVRELVFGRENFSGRLPVSIPTDTSCHPTYYNQYDYWHTRGGYIDEKELISYPFGYGLSYSSFAYSDFSPERNQITIGENVRLTLNVKNTSSVDGTEVLQLYYRDTVCKILTPVRTLIDFKRVALKGGECAKVEFNIATDKLGYLDEKCQLRVDPGEIKFFISGNGRDFINTKINLVK